MDSKSVICSPLVQSLLRSHPNEITHPHPLWLSTGWWQWSKDQSRWRSLLEVYNGSSSNELDDIPSEIIDLIHSLRQTELDRKPIIMSSVSPSMDTKRMSPKKAHEVRRMVDYLDSLLRPSNTPSAETYKPRFVDVGAGQGYLSRALAAHFDTDVLALDADCVQTSGAQRTVDSRITHRTLLVDPSSLRSAIDEWLSQLPKIPADNVPVVLVALHACGSLSPDILRAFLSLHAADKRRQSRWNISAVAVVGCCYNLLRPEDCPLSQAYSSCFPNVDALPPAAYHLATQTPSHWLDTRKSSASAELSIKKVVWRAALAHLPSIKSDLCSRGSPDSKNTVDYPIPVIPARPAHQTPRSPDSPENPLGEVDPGVKAPLPFSRIGNGTIAAPRNKSGKSSRDIDSSTGDGGIGSVLPLRRLGRLPDSAYADWSTFLLRAGQKIGMELSSSSSGRSPADSAATDETHPTATQLETLHVLRCLLGPAIESLILRDRLCWVKECLGASTSSVSPTPSVEEQREPVSVSLVNIFDQGCESARNVAIVVAPQPTNS
ncbi:hypothetical protein HGRIS_005901 [Hohenbuehelia grisea]|uniref:Methyltransferase domain-containing protein n=1 Tax=Hohenbuehelia grisea TaxID=104357 RepID=A0ABR3JZ46_9AGAR